MLNSKTTLLILAVSLVAYAPWDVAAQPRPDATFPRLVQECLPPHLTGRMRPIEVSEKIRTDAGYRALNDAKCWPAGKVLRVSFLEGNDKQACRKIARIANEWTDRERNSIAFDFGQKDSKDDCRVFEVGDQSEIRITFRYRGFWSLVGQDSRKAIPGEPTMSLENLDIAPPDDPEFRAAVLHEFGHALGFLHEHQYPKSHCQFDWKEMYERFQTAADPWDPRKVDLNFKGHTYFDGQILVADDDPSSVMHHYLAPWMLKDGEKNPCYTPSNSQLSEGDRNVAERAYPRRTNDRNRDASDELLNLANDKTLPEDTRRLLSLSGVLLADSITNSGGKGFSGGGGKVFGDFLAAMTELAESNVNSEYFRGAWVALRKSAEQESRLFTGWTADIESYSRRFGVLDDRTQKNIDKMIRYASFYDGFHRINPPGPRDEPGVFREKLKDLVEQGRKLPR
ncbi:MAG: hypothetical protein ACLQGP_02110 [Isosphaeraceae bacterium]